MSTTLKPNGTFHLLQRGSALLFAMIILAALTFIGIAAVSTGVMEMRMARNVEDQMEAFQVSQAALDYVIANPANLPTSGPLNDPQTIPLEGALFTAADGELVQAQAERTIDCGLPPRGVGPSSLLAFSSFSYRIHADIDKRPSGRGDSRQRMGYLTLGPKC